MANSTQLERYKTLIAFIETNFKEDINIERIEAVCHYSYRNINRIFQAIHNETIGKYIKRLRLEKGAQYLIYSDIPVSDIAYEVGFEDRASFSKAFKKKYACSPNTFRKNKESLLEKTREAFTLADSQERVPLSFEISFLPKFDYLFLEYRGDHQDFSALDNTWKRLETYGLAQDLLSARSVPMIQVIDDEQISDQINTRYNVAISLDQPLSFEPPELFRTGTHQRQKYAKFIHQGTPESSFKFYQQIYAFWMLDVALELADQPILEFYPNFDEHEAPAELLTEIYIPVM